MRQQPPLYTVFPYTTLFRSNNSCCFASSTTGMSKKKVRNWEYVRDDRSNSVHSTNCSSIVVVRLQSAIATEFFDTESLNQLIHRIRLLGIWFHLHRPKI